MRSLGLGLEKFVVLSVFLAIIVLMTLPLTSIQFSSAASALVVPTQFPTIQAAIDAAHSGNTIKVLPGTYTEQLVITKNLLFIGSGAKNTVIKAPEVLQPSQISEGRANIIELSNTAKIIMKGFTIAGPNGSNCDNLFGVTIADGAALNLDSSAIKGCTIRAVTVGFCGLCFPNGPQVGHAIITKTDIIGYHENGIQSGGEGSTLSISNSKVIAADAPEIPGQVGILFGQGSEPQLEEDFTPYILQLQEFSLSRSLPQNQVYPEMDQRVAFNESTERNGKGPIGGCLN